MQKREIVFYPTVRVIYLCKFSIDWLVLKFSRWFGYRLSIDCSLRGVQHVFLVHCLAWNAINLNYKIILVIRFKMNSDVWGIEFGWAVFVIHLFSYDRYPSLLNKLGCVLIIWNCGAFLVTVVTVQTRMHNFCIVELRITVNNIGLLNVAQKCFYG